MLYRWAKRLESVQFPATAFPSAGGDPAVETDESHELDAALVAGAIAAVWVLLQSLRELSNSLELLAITYLPILLVALLAALLVRPETSRRVLVAHGAAYVLLAAVMGAMWSTSAQNAIVWAALFAVLGLVTGAFVVVAWAAALHQLATPGTPLHNNAAGFRVLCVAVVLGAAWLGAMPLIPTAGVGQ